MEKVVMAFKIVAPACAVANMIWRIITVRKDTEIEKLSKDVSTLIFLVLYLVLATMKV